MNSNKKKVLITGSSGGIGSALSDRYLEEGFKLVLTSSTEEKMETLKKKIW